jgi:hypothetical protein
VYISLIASLDQNNNLNSVIISSVPLLSFQCRGANVNATDIHDLSGFAWNVYKSCEDSSSNLNTIAGKISELYLPSKKTNELLEEDSISTSSSLSDAILKECYRVLQEIQSGLDKYKTFPAQVQRTWVRMGYGVEEAKRLEQELTTHLQDLEKLPC